MIQSKIDRETTRGHSLIAWLMALLALLPVALFAYLGTFSRLMRDDFRWFSKLQDLNVWANMLYWWENWNGSYSVNILHGLLEPLGAAAVPLLFPVIIIILWLIGLTWLISHLLRILQFQAQYLPIAIALAALILVATMKALYTWESIYWYSASARYAFPVAVLCICLAAVFQFAGQPHSKRSTTLAVSLMALTCFLNAGFSELYMLFQLLSFLLVAAGIHLFIQRSQRRSLLILAAAGFAASFASFIVQISAPGAAIRMASADAAQWAYPVRQLPDLLARTLNLTFQYIGHQEAFAGFMMLFGIGLYCAMVLYQPKPRLVASKSATLSLSPFWLALIMQLCFVLVLWTHYSDSPQFLGRFSLAFMSVVCINTLMIISLVFLILQKRRVDKLFKTHANSLVIYCGLILLAVVALFLITQLRSIHYKAASYLFLTALTLLTMLVWQLSTMLTDTRVWRFGAYTLFSSVVVIAAIVMPAAVGLYVYGTVFIRVLTLTAFLQVSLGLVWGVYLGFLLQRLDCGPAGKTWKQRFRGLGFLIALIIMVSIVSDQLRLIPLFSTYADEWDKRHEQLVRLSDSDVKRVEVPPYSFDLTAYLSVVYTPLQNSEWAAEYYGLDAIVLRRGEN